MAATSIAATTEKTVAARRQGNRITIGKKNRQATAAAAIFSR
jgi:hypothetical protein